MITQRHYDILQIMTREPASVRSMLDSLYMRESLDSNLRYNFNRLLDMQAIELYEPRTTHQGTQRQVGAVYSITKTGHGLMREFERATDVVVQRLKAQPNRIDIFALPVYRPALHNSGRQGVAYL